MRTRAVALSVAAIAAASIAGGHDVTAGPRRSGRLVRVPRPPLRLSTAVRTCELFEENRAVCNRPVETGEIGVVIDEQANVGPATIRGVAPQTDACGNLAVWNIEFELQTSGTVDSPGRGLLVLDLPLEERARTLSPPSTAPRDGERVLEVIDVDGDGDGDLRVSQYSCDHAGALDRTSRPTHICTDTWLTVRDRWQRARSDRSPVCDR